MEDSSEPIGSTQSKTQASPDANVLHWSVAAPRGGARRRSRSASQTLTPRPSQIRDSEDCETHRELTELRELLLKYEEKIPKICE